MVKYYKNGFYETHIEGSVEISDEYWRDLLKGQTNGQIIISDDNGYPILKSPVDTRNYTEKRIDEYPSIGDMIDAIIKARNGNDEELNTLCVLREKIKTKYPKD